MPLFRYFSAESGLQTLSACELMVIPPKYLNDAFECSPVVQCRDPRTYTTAQLDAITRSPDWFMENRAYFPNYTFEQFQTGMKQHASQLLEALVAEIPDVDLQLETNAQDIISEKFGVVCFTEDGLHHVMWGTYGSSHTGLAIEFREDHQLFSGRSFLKVEYSNAPVILDASNRNNRDNVELFLKRKPSVWSYECESRLIVELSVLRNRHTPAGLRYFLPVDPLLITSVTLGLRIAPEHQLNVLQTLNRPDFGHVKRFKIQKDTRAGALKRVGL